MPLPALGLPSTHSSLCPVGQTGFQGPFLTHFLRTPKSLSKCGIRASLRPPPGMSLKNLIRTFDQQLPAFPAHGPLMAWCSPQFPTIIAGCGGKKSKFYASKYIHIL